MSPASKAGSSRASSGVRSSRGLARIDHAETRPGGAQKHDLEREREPYQGREDGGEPPEDRKGAGKAGREEHEQIGHGGQQESGHEGRQTEGPQRHVCVRDDPIQNADRGDDHDQRNEGEAHGRYRAGRVPSGPDETAEATTA